MCVSSRPQVTVPSQSGGYSTATATTANQYMQQYQHYQQYLAAWQGYQQQTQYYQQYQQGYQQTPYGQTGYQQQMVGRTLGSVEWGMGKFLTSTGRVTVVVEFSVYASIVGYLKKLGIY